MIATRFQSYLQLRRFTMIKTLSVRNFGCDGAAGGTPEVIRLMEEKLNKAFEPTVCKIIDPVGDMNSIVIKIVSPKFQRMLPIARHRAINELLKEEFKLIHAVQIDAKTPPVVPKWVRFVNSVKSFLFLFKHQTEIGHYKPTEHVVRWGEDQAKFDSFKERNNETPGKVQRLPYQW